MIFKTLTLFLIFSLILIVCGLSILSAEPVKLPSLGIIPPERTGSGFEGKEPVKANSLGVIPPQPPVGENKLLEPIKLPTLNK